MERATYTKKMGMMVLVEWTPSTSNREADALANGDSSLFDPRRRVHLETDVQWEVPDGALRMGREGEAETATARAEKRLPERTSQRMKKIKPTELLTHGDLSWSLVELSTRLSEPQVPTFFLLSHVPLPLRLSLTVSFAKQFYFAIRCVLSDCVGLGVMRYLFHLAETLPAQGTRLQVSSRSVSLLNQL